VYVHLVGLPQWNHVRLHVTPPLPAPAAQTVMPVCCVCPGEEPFYKGGCAGDDLNTTQDTKVRQTLTGGGGGMRDIPGLHAACKFPAYLLAHTHAQFLAQPNYRQSLISACMH